MKTFYLNNDKAFLVLYQFWMKFSTEFFYLEDRTIKFAIIYEANKMQNLLREIEKLVKAHTRVTVLSKCFFLEKNGTDLSIFFYAKRV